MVGGNAWLQCGVDEDLAIGCDFEDSAIAVAFEEVSIHVEGCSCGDAHAFCIDCGFAAGVDAINGPFGARGDVEFSIGIEGEAGGVHDSAYERCSNAIRAYAHDGYRGLLAAWARDRGEGHS